MKGDGSELHVTLNDDGEHDLAAKEGLAVCEFQVVPMTDFKYVYLFLDIMTWDFEGVGMCQAAANWAKKPNRITNKTT